MIIRLVLRPNLSAPHVPSLKDAPLYEYVINARQGGQANDTAHMFQFIVHASLDVYAIQFPVMNSLFYVSTRQNHASLSFHARILCSIDETLWTSNNMCAKLLLPAMNNRDIMSAGTSG
jgi:hypothetical protein